jgi:hypothetical protein
MSLEVVKEEMEERSKSRSSCSSSSCCSGYEEKRLGIEASSFSDTKTFPLPNVTSAKTFSPDFQPKIPALPRTIYSQKVRRQVNYGHLMEPAISWATIRLNIDKHRR